MSRPPRPSRPSCDGDDEQCCKDEPVTARTLAELVNHFIKHYRARALAERARFAAIKSRRKAIEIAALSRREDGKVHDHQRRVGKVALRKAADLLVADGLRSVKDFDDLIARVTKVCAPVNRFGALAQYDVASRIGANLGLDPERVYVHTGALEGARALGLRHGPSSHDGHVIAVEELPPDLRHLEPHEVENLLCIHADQVGRFRT